MWRRIRINKVLEKLKDKTFVSLTVLAAVGILLRAYPHTTIPDLMPDDEYYRWLYFDHLIRTGQSAENVLLTPHLQFYLMYAVYLATEVNKLILFKYVNAVIGGVAVFAFYFMCAGLMNSKKAIYASMLYTFSEAMFYRSCYFGTTEPLSLLWMFLFFSFCLRKKFKSAAPLAVLMSVTHSLPFFFSAAMIATPLLIKKKTLPITMIVLLLFGLFLISPLSPDQRQTHHLISRLSQSFNLKNVFIYNLTDLLSGLLLYYPGTFLLGLFSIFKFQKSSRFEQIFLLLACSAAFFSLLFYNTAIFSPVRFIPYAFIPLSIFFANNYDEKILYFIIITAMLTAPYLGGGLQEVHNINDSLTAEEVDALNWLKENGYLKQGMNSTWWCDEPIRQYLAGVTYAYGKPFFYPPIRDLLNSTNIIGKNFQYVFISERMEKQAFFLEREPFIERSAETRVSAVDVWKNNSDWIEIYNKNGVKIYARNEEASN